VTVIEKALAKSLRVRFERIDEMVQALTEFQAELDSDAVTRPIPALRAHTSIAVLPFTDMSASRDQEFLCDGIAEEILRALSRIPDLRVAVTHFSVPVQAPVGPTFARSAPCSTSTPSWKAAFGASATACGSRRSSPA
jgi:hypothetical protein